MQVKAFPVTALATNCYVVHSQGEALIVDPGAPSQEVLEFLEQENLKVVGIVNTHGHSDHISGNAWFKEQTGAPLSIHEADAPFLKDPRLHLGAQVRLDVQPVEAENLLLDGSLIGLGEGHLEVLHTPGHTPGGICLYAQGILLSGDTLFKGSVGRWDLPGADEAALMESLKRLTQLPPETKVYPGHGSSTMLEYELNTNPFLRF